MSDDNRTLLCKVFIVLYRIRVRVGIHVVTYRLIRDLPYQRHDLVVKDCEIRIDEQNSVVAGLNHHIAACAGNDIRLPLDVPDNCLDLRNPCGIGRLKPAIVWNWRSEERRVGKECRSRWSPY